MITQLIDWDQQLLLFLNHLQSEYWNRAMWMISDKFTWIPMILVLVAMLFRKNWKEALLVVMMVALVITLCDQFASSICKPYFARFRPARDPEIGPLVQIVNGYRGGRYGFISSHAANSFGAAFFLSLLFRHKGFTWTVMLWAAINSYSRIYLGVHYPGDILAGTLSGFVWGGLVWYIYTALRTAMNKKGWLPDTAIPYRDKVTPLVMVCTIVLSFSVIGILAFF